MFGFWTVVVPTICLDHNLHSRNLMSSKNQVTLGDNKKIQVEDRGIVSSITNKGNAKTLQDVILIPSSSHNLLSVGQLMVRWTLLY